MATSLALDRLVDVDWTFGVTAGSDVQRRSNATFVRLKITLLSPDSQLENIHLELSIAQFYELMKQLEEARLALAKAS
ncbi:hypothetical protein H696_00604 [Fonticula alba]|uniref:COMM domain-containing protein n=1 Tax=Fonticula alba TaxID=691883 RepID=A0A058ZGJ9_FONAL|nr:hypothetical protein H696_00604 [Fonticula alba]KCV73058.1 hypothetical protein H696_00604 [Fonticula alba]|eukprot:XP_009492759.1 hypothetical protein H696_00604 [Fonticula alba]